MLINGVHLLPDPSGALLWPKRRLLILADPGADTAAEARAVLERLGRLLRRGQPGQVVCLGTPAGRAAPDETAWRKLTAATDWTWLTEDAAVAGRLGGATAESLTIDALTLRPRPLADAGPGELAAGLRPRATAVLGGDRVTLPCFLFDGRRLVLPAFARGGAGLDVLEPGLRPLFKRGFSVALLAGERLITLPRQRLEGCAAAPRDTPAPPREAGRKWKLM